MTVKTAIHCCFSLSQTDLRLDFSGYVGVCQQASASLTRNILLLLA